MQLVLLHDYVAHRDCQDCIRNFYEEDGPNKGQLRIGKDGNPEPRPKGTKPPCRRTGCSCPKGSPENPITLSERNWQAWAFYKRCKLTGRWPDDPIVLEFGVLLEDVLERVREVRQSRLMLTAAVATQASAVTTS